MSQNRTAIVVDDEPITRLDLSQLLGSWALRWWGRPPTASTPSSFAAATGPTWC